MSNYDETNTPFPEPEADEGVKAETPAVQDEQIAEPAVASDGTEMTDADTAPKPQKDPLSAPKAVFEYLEMFATALCAVLLIFMFALRFCSVKGPSMEKTLFDGEKLFVSNLFYTPERGDIVIFHQTGGQLNEPVVKRVIATGGEWVKVDYVHDPDRVIVTVRSYDENGKLLEEVLDESEYAYVDASVSLYELWEYQGFVQVPEGHVFVLGDNRNHSWDSRDADEIGFVDERRILGRVLFRVYPFSGFGAVD